VDAPAAAPGALRGPVLAAAMALHALLVAGPAWLLLVLAGAAPRPSPALWGLLALVGGWGVLEARWTSAQNPRDGGAAGRLPGLQGLLLWLLMVLAARTLMGGPAGAGASVGAALVLAGIGLRLAAIRALAGQFRTRLAGAPGQVLVVRGLYGWIRHPSELGHVGVVVGLAAIAGAGPLVVPVLAAALLLAVVRVRREDLALARDHGPRFAAHAAAVGAWSPVRTLCARVAARRRRAH